MKKMIVRVFLILIMILAISGCEQKETKEDIVANAKQIDVKEVMLEEIENSARASQKYVGNIYKTELFVSDIESNKLTSRFNYVVSGKTYWGTVYVYMEQSELAKLNDGETIKIVGKITSISPSIYIKEAFIIE